jgi:hypothetical protein
MALTLLFTVLADISKAAPVFSVVNQTAWDEATSDQLAAMQYFVTLTTPSGVVLYDSGTPLATGNSWETVAIPAVVPLVNGHVEWGGDGYLVQVTLRTQDSRHP